MIIYDNGMKILEEGKLEDKHGRIVNVLCPLPPHDRGSRNVRDSNYILGGEVPGEVPGSDKIAGFRAYLRHPKTNGVHLRSMQLRLFALLQGLQTDSERGDRPTLQGWMGKARFAQKLLVSSRAFAAAAADGFDEEVHVAAAMVNQRFYSTTGMGGLFAQQNVVGSEDGNRETLAPLFRHLSPGGGEGSVADLPIQTVPGGKPPA